MVPPVKRGVRAAPQGVFNISPGTQLPLTARQMDSDVGLQYFRTHATDIGYHIMSQY